MARVIVDGFNGPGAINPHVPGVLAAGTLVKRNLVSFIAPEKDILVNHADGVRMARKVDGVYYRTALLPNGTVVNASIYGKPGQKPIPPPKSILSRVQVDFQSVGAHGVKAYTRASLRVSGDSKKATVANLNKAAAALGKKFQ